MEHRERSFPGSGFKHGCGTWGCTLLVLCLFVSTAGAQEAWKSSAELRPCVMTVVAPADSPLADISRLFLRLTFLGEIIYMDELIGDDENTPQESREMPIHLCLDASAERPFLRQFLSRNYLQYRRYWADRILSGEVGNPPLRSHNEKTFVACLARSANSIGILCWNSDHPVPDGLKIISIDGKRPGESGYLAN